MFESSPDPHAPAVVLGRPATPFVADFVGADRGVKRIGVTAVDAQDLEHLPSVATGWVAVVDGDGRYAGVLTLAALHAGARRRPDAPNAFWST